MTIGQTTYRSVAELAQGKTSPVFNRIFKVQSFHPACVATPELEQKYGVAIDNVQEVVSVQNIVTADLTWWNPARKTKPQNFQASAGAGTDPTGGGGPAACDFCAWPSRTAADTWGRVERPHAVSASNLFKYGAPAQGVILFKHHDPLSFNFDQFSDLLTVADGWFNQATTAALVDGHASDQLHPLLVWNALARAGASQFHGHAQTMLSAAPLPVQTREKAAAAAYAASYPGSSYYTDLAAAHASVGLARRVAVPSGGEKGPAYWGTITQEEAAVDGYLGTGAGWATAHASLCPTKDAEITVLGASLTCPAFQLAFYDALRALIDGLGVQSFNAGVYNVPLAGIGAGAAGGAGPGMAAAPVVAKVVSRGRLAAAASDYGGLEVFAGATIGHTSPWDVVAALDSALAGAGAQLAGAQRAGARECIS